MRRFLTSYVIMIIVLAFVFVWAGYTLWHMNDPRITQKWTVFMGKPNLETDTWYGKEIVLYHFDPIETVTDSLKKARIKEGEQLIAEIQKK